MTGFIDLVFRHNGKYYIIDWKSNIIDKTPESFKEKGLKREIAKNFYFLQYLLYSVALDRFLAQTLSGYSYEQHFGGVYYIFLRGIEKSPESTRGVFYEKADIDLINKLSNLFI